MRYSKKYSVVKKSSAFNKINIIPMIDLMLILLITFMFISIYNTSIGKSSVSTIDISLPKYTDKDSDIFREKADSINIIYKNNQEILINKTKTSENDFLSTFKSVSKDTPMDKEIYLYFNKDIIYYDIVQAVSKINSQGFFNTIFVTENE